jgi:hypothetical protein
VCVRAHERGEGQYDARSRPATVRRLGCVESHTISSSHRCARTGGTTVRSSVTAAGAIRRLLDRCLSVIAFESPPLPAALSPAALCGEREVRVGIA